MNTHENFIIAGISRDLDAIVAGRNACIPELRETMTKASKLLKKVIKADQEQLWKGEYNEF